MSAVRARLVLRRQFLGAVAVAAVAFTTAAVGLWRVLDTASGHAWMLVAGGVLAWLFGFVYYHLDGNRVDGTLQAGLGLANAVTMVRGGLLAAVAGFVFYPPAGLVAWLPALCYGTNVLLDGLDGWVAREIGAETALGRRLDAAMDTLGLAAAPLVGVAWGTIPVWYLAQSAARCLFRTGRGFRRLRGRPVYPLPESRVRRPLAALQMVFVTVALVPAVPRGPVTVAAAVVLAPSLAVFVRDYLAVVGVLTGRGEL